MSIYDNFLKSQLNSKSAFTCSFALSAKALKSYPPSKIDTTFPLQSSFARVSILSVKV